MRDFRNRVVAATPLMCLITYLFVGFYYDIWHPTWAIFLLIPVMPILLGLQRFRITYPTFCAIGYVLLGVFLDMWHPGWLIFLTIPVFYILFPTNSNSTKGKIHID